MIEKLGTKAVALPAIALTFIALILGTVFYPLAHSQMKDVPFGIAILDSGVETPAGTVNAGEKIADFLEKTGSTFSISRYSSQEEVETALNENEVYGVLVFPDGFTAAQLQNAQQGQGVQQGQGAPQNAMLQNAPTQNATPQNAPAQNVPAQSESAQNEAGTPLLTLYVNVGKNQMLATQIAQLLPTRLATQGIQVQVEQVNTADVGTGMMAMMGVAQVLVMPIFMMSMIASVLLFVIFKPTPTNGRSWRTTVIKQVVYALIIATLIAAFDLAIASWSAGLSLPTLRLFAFFYIASLCLILAFVGALDIAAPLGGLAIASTFAFGMMTAMLPREMMPDFWRNWVCPWSPQYNIGEGVRAIVHFDSGIWTSGTPTLLAFGVVGIILLSLVALVKRAPAPTTDTPENSSEATEKGYA